MDVVATLQARDRLYDKSGQLNRMTTLLLVLATLFVCLRLWARYISPAGYGADDWTILASLVFVSASAACNYAAAAHGLGRHTDTVSMDDLVTFFKIFLAYECIWVTAILLVKISVLLTYRRLFPLHEVRIALAIITAIVISWWIALLLVYIFQCNPISKAWLPWIEGTCINLKASFIGNAIPNILTDVAILCVPIKPVWKLHLRLAQRLSILFMFLLGSFVLFSSIYRFTTLMEVDVSDPTWTFADGAAWCVAEAACAVISACLPTLRPLMAKISRQFGNLTDSEPAPSDPNNQSRGPIELVTIRGTKRSKLHEKHFQRLQNEGDDYGIHTVITRSKSLTEETGHSDAELPLNGTLSTKPAEPGIAAQKTQLN
ncbi:hypothetical protein GQ44DRAFT_744627 [Phaeosphaeriaceae sp. PMI808]|nr:hypothetical protein GQ44DRAFT_744627 [Phaeosphaeriaceae sp. PMI808]